MKRILLFVLTLGVARTHSADFRTVNWGMTAETVKKIEVAKISHENESELVYTISMGGQPVEVRYNFDEGRLSRAQYCFVRAYRETEKYVEAYDALQGQLEKKYGKPVSALQRCEDEFYAEYPKRWGTGIVVGKLTRESSWVNGKIRITHSIRALPGGSVGHAVSYEPAVVSRTDFENAEVLGAL